MAGNNYNLSAKLRKLKKLAQTRFLAGQSVDVVSSVTGLSKDLLKEWHDEFIVDVVQQGPSRRACLRELLLKNAPQMIMILTELARAKGDEKLSYQCASAILAFSAKFMNEDVKILQAEQAVNKDNDNDNGFRRTLFDIADPDVGGSKRQRDEAGLFEQATDRETQLSDESIAKILAAAESLEEKGLIAEDEQPKALINSKTETSNLEEFAYKGEPELFDGIKD